MNVNQIEIALSQKISASSTNFDLLAASKALQLLKTNGVFVVSSYGGLPAAASNEGKIYFIEDIETVVWSNGTDWLRLLDKNTIQFQLWSWGQNLNGKLGDGTTIDRCSPVREFCSATNWCQVSSGRNNIVAIKSSGELWTWGSNACGALGDGTTTCRCSPVREFCFATDWCQVSAGVNGAAVKNSGQLWLWGSNSSGQLGDGTTINKCSPVREFCSATDWCQVAQGNVHTVALKSTGEIWSWGCGSNGRLADGTTINRCSPVREISSSTNWCQVSAEGSTVFAVKTTGQLWSWSFNGADGRLGDGTTIDRCSPVREFCSATDWCQVAGGGVHASAIKTSGELWSWGSNTDGVLGIGTLTSSFSPVREFCSATDWCQSSGSIFSTHALKTSGQIWNWGRNNFGALGDGTTINRCSPVREISSSTNWLQVSSACYNAIALKIV
jgi:alpha-tubulin suppressor-like RCC1 family protein